MKTNLLYRHTRKVSKILVLSASIFFSTAAISTLFPGCEKKNFDKISAVQIENSETSRSGKPNIILIMADDIGYEVPTCNGGQSYQTPNIDIIAENGLRCLLYT